ncbi:MAG TPA: hypothetical protein VMC81_10800 [Rhodocyclaceae bacterium]|nr:hypothetical protein [Rhodocyclaceae bacterium]
MGNNDFETGYLIGVATADDSGVSAAKLNHAHNELALARRRVAELEKQVHALRHESRESRAIAAGKDAVRQRLLEALAEVAPHHPLAHPFEANPLRDAIFDEAAGREYDLNPLGPYDG